MPKDRPTPPTVRSRRLAAELRRLREAAGLTREQVSTQTGINPATLYRHETATARSRPQRRTMIALLNLYGATDQQREDLLALSREVDVQGWLRPYHAELPEPYTTYISFEAEARAVRNYESLFIPGLLQTEDYARAVIRGNLPMATPTQVDQRVQARMERQVVLSKDSPLQLWAIVDEAALHRQVGGAAVMRSQLEKLLETAEQPHVTVQVIPYAAGAHGGMQGSYILLDFPNSADPAVVYVESMAGDLFLEAEADIRRYSLVFDTLRAQALSPDDTAGLITNVAAGRQ
ncbi:helix-turn-helix domain-containing protein [Frankia nepalensis]|uniref:helix-turn-helix domain-containing protein n=1 Tax=Frankia nepalensis TaxID=1836974 RepID=UPI0027DD1160|nr:helix-turn-helix transcriptional regulator [Frankia nepalensis]